MNAGRHRDTGDRLIVLDRLTIDLQVNPDVASDLEAQRPFGGRIDVSSGIELERDERRPIFLTRRRAFVHRRQVVEPHRKFFEHGVAAPHDRRAPGLGVAPVGAHIPAMRHAPGRAKQRDRRYESQAPAIHRGGRGGERAPPEKRGDDQPRHGVAQHARPQPHREHGGGGGDRFEREIERGAVESGRRGATARAGRSVRAPPRSRSPCGRSGDQVPGGDAAEVSVHHHVHETLEVDGRLPAQFLLRLGGIANQVDRLPPDE